MKVLSCFLLSYEVAVLTVYQAVFGAVEELAVSNGTLTLARNQFETNFFGPVNVIKAVLPLMRAKSSGHIMVLAGISMFSVLFAIGDG